MISVTSGLVAITNELLEFGMAMDLKDAYTFPAESRYFSVHHSIQTVSEARTAFYPVGTVGSSPGVKVAGE
jgi:hypothetical protein